jgi:hypothetical protein
MEEVCSLSPRGQGEVKQPVANPDSKYCALSHCQFVLRNLRHVTVRGGISVQEQLTITTYAKPIVIVD